MAEFNFLIKSVSYVNFRVCVNAVIYIKYILPVAVSRYRFGYYEVAFFLRFLSADESIDIGQEMPSKIASLWFLERMLFLLINSIHIKYVKGEVCETTGKYYCTLKKLDIIFWSRELNSEKNVGE